MDEGAFPLIVRARDRGGAAMTGENLLLHPQRNALVDGSPVTLVCALTVEEAAARRAGARVARVGLAASLPLPDTPIVGFGLAGALVNEVAPGTLVTASRIVDEEGGLLWERDPLSVPEAEAAVLCSADGVVDDPAVRKSLAARTGAIAVDMESRALAASGRLVGVVRAISDTPARPVGCLACAAKPDGRVAWGAVIAAFAREPRTALRSARSARLALASLERAAEHLAANGGATQEMPPAASA